MTVCCFYQSHQLNIFFNIWWRYGCYVADIEFCTNLTSNEIFSLVIVGILTADVHCSTHWYRRVQMLLSLQKRVELSLLMLTWFFVCSRRLRESTWPMTVIVRNIRNLHFPRYSEFNSTVLVDSGYNVIWSCSGFHSTELIFQSIVFPVFKSTEYRNQIKHRHMRYITVKHPTMNLKKNIGRPKASHNIQTNVHKYGYTNQLKIVTHIFTGICILS